jgi:hypothetical protein
MVSEIFNHNTERKYPGMTHKRKPQKILFNKLIEISDLIKNGIINPKAAKKNQPLY